MDAKSYGRVTRSVAGAVILTVAAAAGLRAGEPVLGLHPDASLASKYMAHGWNIGGDHPAWEPSLTFDAFVPGLQLTAWYNVPVDTARRQFVEEDYLLKYNRTILGDTACALNLHGYVDYWFYPNTPGDGVTDATTGKTGVDLRGYKLHGGVSFLKCTLPGDVALVPSYNYYFWTPQDEDAFADGGVHELFLAGALPLAKWAAWDDLPALNVGGSMNYHEGALGTKEGWSHATAHLSATFNLGGFKLTPSVNYQWSFEDTVNTENDFWAVLSLARDF